MLLRRRRSAALDDDDPNVIVEHGPSLAKGPALLVGSILVAFGLTGLLKNATFPDFSSNFPNGTANGSSWLGFEVNGWTNWLAIAAGALLLFGAAQHHLAKTMSLIVGAALAACAVIAIIDGHDVLGLAAANAWTKLGLAVAGGAMLVNALMPRTTRRRHIDELRGASLARARADRADAGEGMAAGAGATAPGATGAGAPGAGTTAGATAPGAPAPGAPAAGTTAGATAPGATGAREREPARDDAVTMADREQRFDRPVESPTGIGRAAADRDIAEADADRTIVAGDGSGAVRGDDDVPPRPA